MHDLGSAHKPLARPQTVTPGSIREPTQKTVTAFRDIPDTLPSSQGAAMPKTPPAPERRTSVSSRTQMRKALASCSPLVHIRLIRPVRSYAHSIVPTDAEGPLVPRNPTTIPANAFQYPTRAQPYPTPLSIRFHLGEWIAPFSVSERLVPACSGFSTRGNGSFRTPIILCGLVRFEEERCSESLVEADSMT